MKLVVRIVGGIILVLSVVGTFLVYKHPYAATLLYGFVAGMGMTLMFIKED